MLVILVYLKMLLDRGVGVHAPTKNSDKHYMRLCWGIVTTDPWRRKTRKEALTPETDMKERTICVYQETASTGSKEGAQKSRGGAEHEVGLGRSSNVVELYVYWEIYKGKQMM